MIECSKSLYAMNIVAAVHHSSNRDGSPRSLADYQMARKYALYASSKFAHVNTIDLHGFRGMVASPSPRIGLPDRTPYFALPAINDCLWPNIYSIELHCIRKTQLRS